MLVDDLVNLAHQPDRLGEGRDDHLTEPEIALYVFMKFRADVEDDSNEEGED